MVIVLGLDVGNIGEKEDDGEDNDDNGNAEIRDPEGLAAGAGAAGVLGVEEEAAGDGAEYPSDAIAGLSEIDAGRGISGLAKDGGVGIGDGFEEGQSGGDEADANKE